MLQLSCFIDKQKGIIRNLWSNQWDVDIFFKHEKERNGMKMSRVSECALHMFNRSGSKAQQRLIKLNFCGCDFNGVAFIRSSLVRSCSLHKCAHVDATIDVRRRGASFFRSRHTNQLGKSMSFTRNPFIKYINSIYFDVHHFDVDFMFLWDYLASFNINSLSLSHYFSL